LRDGGLRSDSSNGGLREVYCGPPLLRSPPAKATSLAGWCPSPYGPGDHYEQARSLGLTSEVPPFRGTAYAWHGDAFTTELAPIGWEFLKAGPLLASNFTLHGKFIRSGPHRAFKRSSRAFKSSSDHSSANFLDFTSERGTINDFVPLPSHPTI
jgi:hypothetical protein